MTNRPPRRDNAGEKGFNTMDKGILVTFYDGTTQTYRSEILNDPISIAYDPSVVEIVDLRTMTVLYAA